MSNLYKPLYLTKDAGENLLENYIENVCNLNHVSTEVAGNIHFAIIEAKELFQNLFSNEAEHGVMLRTEITGNKLSFELSDYNRDESAEEELTIDSLLRRNINKDKEFIISKLADEFAIRNNPPGILLSFFNEGLRYERVMERISLLKAHWNRKVEIEQTAENGN